MFDWNKFKNGEIAAHCDTEEKSKDFLKECYKQGVVWLDGDKVTEISCWCIWKSSTTYACTHGYSKLSYGSAGHYKNKGLEIIDWRVEEMEKIFKEVIADIKEGEVWVGCKYADNRPVIKIESGAIVIEFETKTDGYKFWGDTKFKLKRKEYTFEEAFKAYEEGKEIESVCNGCRYKKENGEDVTIYAADWQDFDCFELYEIRGMWYIND